MPNPVVKIHTGRKTASAVPKGKMPNTDVPDVVAAAKKAMVKIPKATDSKGRPKAL